MKSSRFALLAALCAFAVLPLASVTLAANAPQSARGAVRTLSKIRGSDYLGRIVMIEGRYGHHQPRAWRILTLDPKMQGRMREFMINGDKIDSERLLLAWKYGRRVPLREVTVDSKDAFIQADLAAKDAKIGFDSLNYQLIMPAESREPLWVVTLVRQNGDAVGEVQVGAKTGVVLRKAWQVPGPRATVTRTKSAANPANSASRPVARQQNKPPVRTRPPQHAGAGNRTRGVQPRVSPARPGPRKTSLSGDASTLKETSGQILEGARQGILRTSGNVRDFLKQALKDKQ